MIKVLSIENWEPERTWSWGIVVDELIRNMPDRYDFVRIRRGQFSCDNPRCRRIFNHAVDPGLQDHFDLIFPQNCDSIRLINHGHKTIARIGGLDMSNPDRERYAKEFERVGAVIATNGQLFDIAKDHNTNTVMIPNGVNLEQFYPYPGPRPERPFTLGFAGNIWGQGAEYKGWMPYVQACTRMSPEVEQRHLLHNSNQIAHDEMTADFYHKIDAVVLPSKGEGCSNVVSEALSCGVPVLLTKVGYHGEALEDGVNCLFIERSAESIVAAVTRLMEDDALRTRLSENGRLFAEENHDVRKVAAQYDAIFQKIIAQNEAKKAG